MIKYPYVEIYKTIWNETMKNIQGKQNVRPQQLILIVRFQIKITHDSGVLRSQAKVEIIQWDVLFQITYSYSSSVTLLWPANFVEKVSFI